MGVFDKPQQNTEKMPEQKTQQKQEAEKPPKPKRRMRL